MQVFGFVFLILFVFFGAWLLSGWIMTLFFAYLLTPLFGAPEITFWQGFGLSLFVSFIGGIFNSTSVRSK